MRTTDGGVAPAYNVQVTADAAKGLIADIEVITAPQDAQQLPATVKRLKENFGHYPKQLLADAGYTNNVSIVEMAERDVDFYRQMTGRTDKPSGRAVQRHEDYHFCPALTTTRRPTSLLAPRASASVTSNHGPSKADAKCMCGPPRPRTAATARRARCALSG